MQCLYLCTRHYLSLRFDFSIKETGDILNATENDPITSLPICHGFIVQINAFLRQAAALDICPYGLSSKDIAEFEPDWFEPAHYRIPITDKEQSTTDPSSVVRATKQSKVRCESLLAVIDAYCTAVGAKWDESVIAAANFSKALQSNCGKFDIYMSNLACNVGRRSFIIENDYVGVGPGCLEKGDEAVVFLGAAVPYIFRAASTSKRVLPGDAYIHGIMDGELIERSCTVEVLELAQ